MSNQIIGQVLQERYQIVQSLSAGLFGQTYIAVDINYPEKPRCVIKQLKVNSHQSTSYFDYLRLRFLTETETLKLLGKHPQIPQLITCFEENERFYLVQQFIPGESLAAELPTHINSEGKWSEADVIQFLEDALSILEFVHGQGFIHCDIKPENFIRRASDAKLVLIDFGSIQPIDFSVKSESLIHKIPVTSLGYIPPEQFIDQTQPNSDLYSLGTIAIQALTGLLPFQLQIDPETNEIIWCNHNSEISDYLVAFISHLIRYNYQERFQSASEALWVLKQLEWENQIATGEITINSELSDNNVDENDDVNSNYVSDISEQSSPLLSGLRLGLMINSALIGFGVYSLCNTSQAYSATETLYKAVEKYQSGDLEKAINLAKSIPSYSNVYPEAQASIDEWQKRWETESENYSLAEKAFAESRWADVISYSRKLPMTSYWYTQIKGILQESQAKIESETQVLLSQAYQAAEKQDFASALSYLRQVSPESSAGAMVQQKLNEYDQKRQLRAGYFLYQAHSKASLGDFRTAIQLLKKVPKDTDVYPQAKMKLQEYSQKLLALTQQQQIAMSEGKTTVKQNHQTHTSNHKFDNKSDKTTSKTTPKATSFSSEVNLGEVNIFN